MGCEYWRNSLVGCSRHSPRFFLLFGVLHIRQFFDVTSWVLGWVSLRKCWFLFGIRLIQYSGSVLGDNNKTFRLKSYAPVVSFVYSGFFFVFIVLYCGRKAELGRNGHVDVPMVLQKEYAISRLNFLACLDLQGVDQSAVAKFLPNFYPYRESLIALFREVPTFRGYGFDFLFFLGLLLLFGILDGLFAITWLSSRRIVRNYLHVLLRRSLNRGSRA